MSSHRQLPLKDADALGQFPGRVLLHSGRQGYGSGRYSHLACSPTTVVCSTSALAAPMGFTGSGPFAIGFVEYEGNAWFGIYDGVATYDHDEETTTFSGTPAGIRALKEKLSKPPIASVRPHFSQLRPTLSDKEYATRIEKIKHYLRAGDIYQANFARCLRAEVLSQGDALLLYNALSAQNPAAFGTLIEAADKTLVFASPEMFLKRRGNRLETRPIKGTCSLEFSPSFLTESTKDQAEHLMIVDLERNDLGRVAKIGTVAVDELATEVTLPTLRHLISTVSCVVENTTTLDDVLQATFPGGSITGAPKIRAMEIIRELEPSLRGPYTGITGCVFPSGDYEFSINIRGLVIQENELRAHVGGGIVIDSTAHGELEETEQKILAIRKMLSQF